jgi:hypothetical protein
MLEMKHPVKGYLRSKKRFQFSLLAISLLWYFALFPGRLGFDYSEAIRIMQKGESTDWWTASFWWYLKLTTFNGQTIVFSSLLSLFILGCSLFYLCESLNGEKFTNRIALLVLFCSPLYGGFGVNISHDVFAAAGIIIFTGYHIRVLRNLDKSKNFGLVPLIFGSILVVTTHYGVYLVALNVLLLFYRRNFKLGTVITLVTVATIMITSVGVKQVPKYGPILVFLADLKCVAQHPQAEISTSEWELLNSLAPKTEWKTQIKCSFIDDALAAMPSLDLNKVQLDRELIRVYLNVSARNPAIVALAHFQRASVALPPPFFAGPKNQVNLDPDSPIGLGTNTALQSNPGVLHPSIDEPSVAFKVTAFKPLEVPAQGLVFVVNQASWFWGWGGLWLWPILIYLLLFLKRNAQGSILPILSSTILLHGLLLILGAPLPRYVMATILLGNYLLLVMISEWYLKYIKSEKTNSNSSSNFRLDSLRRNVPLRSRKKTV